MPLGSFTMIVVCAECHGSVEVTMRRDRVEVQPCYGCYDNAKQAAHEDGYDMGYNAAKEDPCD